MLPMSTARSLSGDAVEDHAQEGVHGLLLRRTDVGPKARATLNPREAGEQKKARATGHVVIPS